MRAQRHGFLTVAAIAALSFGVIADASAQRFQLGGRQIRPAVNTRFVTPKINRAMTPKMVRTNVPRTIKPTTSKTPIAPRTVAPVIPTNPRIATPGSTRTIGGVEPRPPGNRIDYPGPAYRGPGIGGIGIGPGIISAIPPGAYGPPPGGPIDNGGINNPPPNRQPPRNARISGVPPANERRMVPDEVVIELPNSVSPQAITALQRRHRLDRIESQAFQLTGSTLYRWRIPDRRSVAAVVRTLEADGAVASVQPNYLFTLQQSEPKPASESDAKPANADQKPARAGDAAQYALAKLRLPEAHGIAKGDNVLVAVIDSGVDDTHPELAGAIAGTFDTLKPPLKPHAHGTAIAALIAGRARLMGTAPAARILAVRAFDPAGNAAEATTFNILKSLDWSAANGARIINMSFAGPADPAIRRSLEAARKKNIVLIAAAGNAGPKSPPLYPAADPNVIAVTATDAEDKLFAGANRGRHIAVAAPGVDILVAVPDGGYQVSSGTSYSAAAVSGIVALMLQRKPDLAPDAVRDTLLATAKDLGPKGRDDEFGAGLTDAYRAVTEEAPAPRVSDAAQRT